MITQKENILAALEKFISQRSGMDWRNYMSSGMDTAGRLAYMADRRTITRQGKHAARMIAFICRYDVPAGYILDAAKGGRLDIKTNGAAVTIDYTTGQYFPTEYRAAVCRVLANAIWRYFRDDWKCDTREKIVKKARGYFGRGIVSHWFN